jgi:hypothetical protein
MTETRPGQPSDDLERRLASFFRSEVERARVDLRRRPLTDRPAMVTRTALPFGPIAAAVVIIVLALLLRPPGAAEPPGASVQGRPPGTIASSPSTASPSASEPHGGDWSLITWSLTPTEPFDGPGNQFLSDVTAWGDGFVAVGYECCGVATSGLVWYSPDGRSWERVPDPERVFESATLDSVEPTADQLAVVGALGDTSAIWLSDDGHEWRIATPADAFVGGGLGGVAWGPAGLVAYGRHADGGAIWLSQDGRSWVRDDSSFRDASPAVVGTSWGYVATSEAGAWWSVDGHSWTPATVEDGARLGQVVVGAEGMLATGQTGPPSANTFDLGGPIVFPEYWHSVDGRAWRRLPAFRQPAGLGDVLVSDGSRIIAVRSTREIRTSTDGLTWQRLDVTADETVDLKVSPLMGFSRAAVGRHGIVGADHGKVIGRDDDAGVWVWFGAATTDPPPRPIEKLPLIHNDGRNDAMCIGGEGGDPGVVCIEIGYYLRNESAQDELVRLSGAVQALLVAPAGSVGRLTEIGPVWDSGIPVVVELLSDDCQVIQRLLPTGDLALIVIPVDGQARIEAPPPPEPLPQTTFAATEACGG